MPERARPLPRPSSSGLFTGLSQKLTELEQEVSGQADRFSAILEIGAALASIRDLDALLMLVIDRVSKLVDAEAATVFLVDDEKGELWSRVMRGSALREIRVPIGSGVAGSVIKNGRTAVLDDAYEDPRFNKEIDRRSGFRTRSMIAAPLLHASGKSLGVLQVLHRKVNAFSAEDVAIVEAVAAQIAAVLDNVILYERLSQQNEELLVAKQELSQAVSDLDLLYEVEKAVSSADQQSDLLNGILEKAMRTVGAQAGSILLVEDRESPGNLFFRSARGDKSEQLVSMVLKPGQGIAGHVAATGESVRVERAEDSEHHDRSIAKKLGVQVGSLLAVPIPGEREILGALELLNKPGGFTAADERLVTLLGGQTGRAILLRKAREEGERKARLAAIGQMLSSVLHDLRTPMTVIGGYAELMAIEESAAERATYSEIIQKQFEHINAMSKETLAFARGERQLFLRKIFLRDFVKEIGEHLERDFDGSGVKLEIELVADGAARVDPNKLKRVVYNIARNAMQAMPDGGKFHVHLARDGARAADALRRQRPGHPAGDRGQALPVVRHRGEEGRHRPRAGDREADHRGARRHRRVQEPAGEGDHVRDPDPRRGAVAFRPMRTMDARAQTLLALAMALTLGCGPRFAQRQVHSVTDHRGQRFSSSAEEQGDARIGEFISSQWSFQTASYWIEGPDGLLLIDAQFVPTALEKEVFWAGHFLGKKPKLGVVLHPSPDRFNGTAYLQSLGAAVVTSEDVRAAIPAVHERWRPVFAQKYGVARYPRELTLPDAIPAATQELQAAGLTVKLHRLGAGSSAAHLVVEWEGHLFVGDLVSNGAHSWFENGRVDEWLQRLDELRALSPKWVHPGRGMPGGPELIDAQAAYLRAVIAAVEAEHPRDLSTPEAIARIRAQVTARFPERAYPEFLERMLRAEWARQAARAVAK